MSDIVYFEFLLCKAKQKNTLVSRNAGDKKNPHPDRRKLIFLNQFN